MVLLAACSADEPPADSSGGGATGGETSMSSGAGASSTGGPSSATGSSGASAGSGGGGGEAGGAQGGAGGEPGCGPGQKDCAGDGVCVDVWRWEQCGCDAVVCAGEEACIAEQCTPPLELDDPLPDAFGFDADAFYWLAYANDQYILHRIAHSASSSETLGSLPYEAFDSPRIAVGDAHVYVARFPSDSTDVVRLPKAGGAAEPISSTTEGLSGNVGAALALADGYVFWTADGGVYRAPLEGGPAEHWVSSYCITSSTFSGGFAYLGCEYNGAIRVRATSMGPEMDPNALASLVGQGFDGATRMMVDASWLYWWQMPDTVLHRAPLVGGVVESYPFALGLGLDVAVEGSIHIIGREGASVHEHIYRYDDIASLDSTTLVPVDSVSDPSRVFGGGGPWLYWSSSQHLYRSPK
jgi:hypothetical protein